MALSPFERDLAEDQGRIAVAGAPEGGYVYDLGHAQREGGSFNVGDYVEVQQTGVNFDGQAALARAHVHVLLPAVLPTSPTAVEWEFTVRLNGSARYTRRLRAEPRELTLDDVAVPTVAALGGDTLAFRLELVNA